ncbi:MAG: response regulator transcription factor [Deltaproteobacteria bacterium]|nr:response regulator transcription factor [Deltaproteobacteria bacterium]
MHDQLEVGILDEQALLREALADALTRRGLPCTVVAGTPEAFLQKLATHPVNLALVDPGLEVGLTAALDLLRRLRDEHAQIRTVVLTHRCGPDQADLCWRAGVYGLLSKQVATPDAVAEALRAAASGEQRFPLELTEPVAPRPAEPSTLTAREREVLGCIASGHDNLKIAALMAISERTVKSHVASIYRKLRLENRVQLAIRARELGISPQA